MFEPVKNLTDIFLENKVDMFNFISMARCANAIKYSMVYNKFEIDDSYNVPNFDPPFHPTFQFWKTKVEGNMSQDKFVNRLIDNNVKQNEFEYFQ